MIVLIMILAISAQPTTVGLIDIEVNHYENMVAIIHKEAPNAEIIGVFINNRRDLAGAIKSLGYVDVIVIPLQTHTQDDVLAAQVQSTLAAGVKVVMAGSNVRWYSRGFMESLAKAAGGVVQKYPGVVVVDRSFWRMASANCAKMAGRMAR